MLIEQPEVNYEHAAKKHNEFYVPAIVSASWWRFVAGVLSVAVLLLSFGVVRALKAASKKQVVVLAESRDGSLDRVRFVEMGDYRPGDKTIEHFVYSWAMEAYSLRRATIVDDFTNSLNFYANDVFRQKKENEETTHWIEEFQNDSSHPEVIVDVREIRMEVAAPSRKRIVDIESDTLPKMTVQLDKHFFLQGHEEKNLLEHWTIEIAYDLIPDSRIPGSMVPTNPIGLQVRVLNETKGF